MAPEPLHPPHPAWPHPAPPGPAHSVRGDAEHDSRPGRKISKPRAVDWKFQVANRVLSTLEMPVRWLFEQSALCVE